MGTNCPGNVKKLCGNYSNNTILDGGFPYTTAECILDGGITPFQISTIILVGGSP
jgi:hypothetical protein